jgi:hypothetical protein
MEILFRQAFWTKSLSKISLKPFSKACQEARVIQSGVLPSHK